MVPGSRSTRMALGTYFPPMRAHTHTHTKRETNTKIMQHKEHVIIATRKNEEKKEKGMQVYTVRMCYIAYSVHVMSITSNSVLSYTGISLLYKISHI